MVNKFRGAAYKKYTTLYDAREGWLDGPTCWRGKWKPPMPHEILVHQVQDLPIPEKPDCSSRSGSPIPTDTHFEVDGTPKALPVLLPANSEQCPDSDDEEQLVGRRPPSPSPSSISSISSVSDISFMSGTSYTSGTLSSGTVSTPRVQTPPLSSSPAVSPPTTPIVKSRGPAVRTVPRDDGTFEEIERSISCRITQPPQPSPIRLSSLKTTKASAPSSRPTGQGASSTKKSSVKAGFSSSAHSKPPPGTVDNVEVGSVKDVYVVVHGDYHGVYLDR